MSAMILPPQPESVDIAAAALLRGDLVAIPTETVYGLAGNIRDEKAVLRIFETKERPTFDPLIVHLPPREDSRTSWLEFLSSSNLIEIRSISGESQRILAQLLDRYWPGPLTVLLPKHPSIPDLVTSGLPTVAIRVPAHPMTQSLLKKTKVPLAAPSANRFGRISPTTAEAVNQELGDRISWILDGGPCAVGLESTIVRVADERRIEVLRPGKISIESLRESALCAVELLKSNTEVDQLAPEAPGMLATHYAPRKPLYLLPCDWGTFAQDADRRRSFFEQLRPLIESASRIGLATFSSEPQSEQLIRTWLGLEANAVSYSLRGDPEEAARNLFSTLRGLDGSSADLLLSEQCPSTQGIGYAIADRLNKAARRLD